MKKHWSEILLILVFLIGLFVLLYPTISNFINTKHQSRAIADYESTVSGLSNETMAGELQKADAYNDAIRTTAGVFLKPSKISGYKEALDVGGTGIMGYISIDKIHVELPIYHSTDDSVLQVGVGHLEGTSLPVGGAGTHCVLFGHRGLPSAELFTHLDRMEIGDTFSITVLNKVLTYKVDQIKTVDPDEVDDLQIVDGKDYCTLVTCTPYGINTQRLLVRGERTGGSGSSQVTSEADIIDPLVVSSVVAAFLLILLLIVLLVYFHRRKNGR